MALFSAQEGKTAVLIMRLIAIFLLVMLITKHMRSIRVFRWEQSVSCGIAVTYAIGMIGLALCLVSSQCGGCILQAYICGTGSLLFFVNALKLWHRWKSADDVTRVVAELLRTFDIQLQKQIIIKVIINLVISVILLLDLLLTPTLVQPTDDSCVFIITPLF